MFKFIFVLFIALLTIVIFTYSYFGGKKNNRDEDIKDMFITEEETDTGFDTNTNDIEIDSSELDDVVESDEENSKGNQDEEFEESSENISSVDDMETINSTKFGSAKVERAKEISIDVATMWLEQDDDKKEWKAVSTSSFLDFVEKNLVVDADVNKRKVDRVEVFALSDEREKEMTIEARVTWYFERDGELFDEHKHLLYITFTMDKDEPKVSELLVM